MDTNVSKQKKVSAATLKRRAAQSPLGVDKSTVDLNALDKSPTPGQKKEFKSIFKTNRNAGFF